jgi:hypothetical protein
VNHPTTSTSITGTLLHADVIGESDRGHMLRLLDRHFEGVTRSQFDLDLAGKTHALLLHDAAGTLQGFSTLWVREAQFDGSPITVVSSGDTIVDPAAWSSAALPREWIAGVFSTRIDFPNGPLFWLLITSGFRTYRLLSTFWQTFYPRFDTTTPPRDQRMLQTLAAEQFGDQYDAATGIVRFTHPQQLRSHLAGVADSRLSDPHVAFFERANPGHCAGDELACLCELSHDNLTRAGRRMVFGAERR